jgi:hypothetical protein
MVHGNICKMLRGCGKGRKVIKPAEATVKAVSMTGESPKLLLAADQENFLPAGNIHVNLAVLDFPNGSPFQGHVADASSARKSGNGIAAHHWTAADVNRITDFECLKRELLVTIVACCAAEEEDHSKDDHPYLCGFPPHSKDRFSIHDSSFLKCTNFPVSG